MFVCLDASKMKWIISEPSLHILQTRRKKLKRVAIGCKGSFCQCNNQKYLQIWLLPRFPITSEKCIIYRPLKHRKRVKIVQGWNLTFCWRKMLKTLTSPRWSWNNCIQHFCFLFLLFKIHVYFTDQAF